MPKKTCLFNNDATFLWRRIGCRKIFIFFIVILLRLAASFPIFKVEICKMQVWWMRWTKYSVENEYLLALMHYTHFCLPAMVIFLPVQRPGYVEYRDTYALLKGISDKNLGLYNCFISIGVIQNRYKYAILL